MQVYSHIRTNDELGTSGCSVTVAGTSQHLLTAGTDLTPVPGSAAAIPGFPSGIQCSGGCAVAGNLCPLWDEVCGMGTQVASAVHCKDSLSLLLRQDCCHLWWELCPYAFCSITTASQGLILLPFHCAFEEGRALSFLCDRGTSPLGMPGSSFSFTTSLRVIAFRRMAWPELGQELAHNSSM